MSDKKPYHEQMAEKIIDALESGSAPWIKPWKAGQVPDKPTNAVTNKPYRGWNSLYLSMLQPTSEDQRWCTYNQAQDLGAQVRQGEKGSVIQYWKFEEKQLKRDEATGKPILDERGKKQYENVRLERPKVFHAVVFHASQIDNMPELPPKKEIPEWERHEAAERYLEASKANIFHDQNDSAFYNMRSDEIHLPPKGQFEQADAYYATALHELGHWTGHESRLDRDMAHPFGSQSYAKEELRAEISSYMLGQELGIGHDPSQHLAYIDHWVDILKKDPAEIFRASSDAQKAVDFLSDLAHTHELSIDEGVIMDSDTFSMLPVELSDKAIESITEAYNVAKEKGFTVEITAKEGNSSVELNYFYEGEPVNVRTHINIDTGALQTKGNDKVTSQELNKQNQTEQGVEQDIATEKTWLAVPYREKNQAKTLGANWDKEAKSWYAAEGTDLKPLARWIPDELTPRQDPALDPVSEFTDALKADGLIINGSPKMDGKLHRVAVVGGKDGQLDGAYKGFLDGLPAGFIQNFKQGTKRNWKATGQKLDQDAIAQQQALIAKNREVKAKELHAQYEQKSKDLTVEFNNAPKAPDSHPYLVSKGLGNDYDLRVDKRGNLLVPISDSQNKIWSVQRIGQKGFKGYEKGGKVEGGSFVLGGRENLDESQAILLSTGFATSASVHQATGLPVVAAFQDNNLSHVAKELRKEYPDKEIFILGDDDRHLPLRNPPLKNSGREKAESVAKEVNGKAIFPQFTANETGEKFTDFSDIHRERGIETVRRQISEQVSVQRTKSQEIKQAQRQKEKEIAKALQPDKSKSIGR
ncbi:DUF1738 domain-containing protein [Vibrio parahaemolyticus]|nr:DUF1738 domain-containing protein [Vibrio parahaemolyticus]